MNTVKLIISIFLVFNINVLQGQTFIKTASGQNAILQDDGSWTKPSPTEAEDTTGMLISGFNPLTAPVEEKYHIDEGHQQAINALKAKSESNEIEFYIQSRKLEKDLSAINALLSQANLLKNKDEASKYEDQIKAINAQIKTTNKSYQKSTKQINACNNLKNKDAAAREKEMAILAKELDIDVQSFLPKKAPTEVAIKKNPSKDGKICQIDQDEVIDKLRSIKIQKQPFYSFTPEKLKTYFKTKELMNVSAYLSKVGSQSFINLSIIISSKDAAKNYGQIQKGNLARITLISGKVMNLASVLDATPMLENYTGNNIYEVSYPIDSEYLNALQNTPIDQLGIMWSSGFESYDIYNVDLLMHQATCLKSL